MFVIDDVKATNQGTIYIPLGNDCYLVSEGERQAGLFGENVRAEREVYGFGYPKFLTGKVRELPSKAASKDALRLIKIAMATIIPVPGGSRSNRDIFERSMGVSALIGAGWTRSGAGEFLIPPEYEVVEEEMYGKGTILKWQTGMTWRSRNGDVACEFSCVGLGWKWGGDTRGKIIIEIINGLPTAYATPPNSAKTVMTARGYKLRELTDAEKDAIIRAISWYGINVENAGHLPGIMAGPAGKMLPVAIPFTHTNSEFGTPAYGWQVNREGTKMEWNGDIAP